MADDPVAPPPSPAPVPPYPAVTDAAGAPVPGRRTGWRRWLPVAAVISLIAAAAVGMLIFLGYNIGPTGLAIGLFAAILPVPLLASSFVWLDRYEPEPTKYLVYCFAWGAAVATAVALVVNSGSAWLLEKAGLPEALVAVLVAPFIEETMKVLGPLLLFWRRRGEWSGITDGIVYCGLSALGFAMVENVLYLGGHGYAAGADEYGPATGLQNVFLIFIVRILFTGFAHPLFTSMAGIGLGIAARSPNRTVRRLAPIAGLLLAMMLHGIFNLLPTLAGATRETMIMLYGFAGFMIPLFFAVVGFAVAWRSWEGRLAERVLYQYAETGWFAPSEVAALGTLGRRHAAREWARRVAGQPGQRAMRDFQFAATRLALLRDGLDRGLSRTPEDLRRTVDEERELLVAITNYRSAFAGRDPQTPPSWWDGHNYRITFPDGVVRTVAPPSEPVMPLPIVLPPPVPVGAGAFSGPYGGPPPTGSYGVPVSGGPYGGPPPAGPYGVPVSGGPYGGPPPAGPYGVPVSGGPYGGPPVLGGPQGAPPPSGPYGVPGPHGPYGVSGGQSFGGPPPFAPLPSSGAQPSGASPAEAGPGVRPASPSPFTEVPASPASSSPAPSGPAPSGPAVEGPDDEGPSQR